MMLEPTDFQALVNAAREIVLTRTDSPTSDASDEKREGGPSEALRDSAEAFLKDCFDTYGQGGGEAPAEGDSA
jgi:hypothetical protein